MTLSAERNSNTVYSSNTRYSGYSSYDKDWDVSLRGRFSCFSWVGNTSSCGSAWHRSARIGLSKRTLHRV